MTDLFHTAQILLLMIFGILAGYQFLLTVMAFRVKQADTFQTEKKRRFAVVVPAHNEEMMIARTIYSLHTLIYPKKLFDVVVVADNCTDSTAETARRLGATVYERFDETNRGKGFALRWIFDKLLKSQNGYDAIVVIDSDSLVSGNYLEVMNGYLEKGSRVIQSSDLVLPQPGNWSIEATRIGFLLFNYVKPLGRKKLNLFAGLRGNGMCFGADVLRSFPWQAWSLTEDVEYGLMLIQQGVSIDFAPEAIVWAQMPVNASNAVSQRTRWESGRRQITRRYAPYFLKESFKRGSFRYFDVFLDLVTPPFVNMMFYISLLFVISLAGWLLSWSSPIPVLLWGVIGVMGLAHFILGMAASGTGTTIYKSILYIFRYIGWKVKVLIRSMYTGMETQWIRTTRDS
jgi:1,2-diacylglycerol 3-beta-glucosyltransferase